LYLTNKEEMALKGEYGEAQQIAYRILYAIGNGANADRLMEAKTSHISGVNYHNIGDAGLELLEDMAKTARFVIPTTINPCGVQVSPPIHLNFKQDLYEKQERILAAFAKMGSRGSYTCIPYEYDNVANMGDHVSWAESSAVVYGNSVLGIMTNRESGLSALASAITGKTPHYGLHLEEKRRAKEWVLVDMPLNDEVDYGVLGYYIGKNFKDTIGIVGLRAPTKMQLKSLSAAIATSGPMGMFVQDEHIPTSSYIRFGKEEYNATRAILDKSEEGQAILLGCPFMGYDELKHFAEALTGKRFTKPTYLFTSHSVYESAASEGIIISIEKSGAKVVQDACPSLSYIPELIGATKIVTSSTKGSFYMAASSKVAIELLSLDEIIRKYTA
jgi:predicted aconitase